MSKIIKYNNLTVDEENKVSIDIPNFNVIDEDENSNEFEINYTAENGGELTPEDILEIAKAQAGSVIGNARKEADYILIEAHKNAVIEAEEIKKNAYDEGYSSGYKKGADEAAVIQKEAKNTLASAKAEKEEILSRIEPELIELVVKVIDKVLNNAKIINPDVIKCIIKKGMSQTKIMGDIFIHVSADDYESAINDKDDIVSSREGSVNIEIIKDLSMNVGDCLIETPFGNIDCGIDQQLKEVKSNLYYILENR